MCMGSTICISFCLLTFWTTTPFYLPEVGRSFMSFLPSVKCEKFYFRASCLPSIRIEKLHRRDHITLSLTIPVYFESFSTTKDSCPCFIVFLSSAQLIGFMTVSLLPVGFWTEVLNLFRVLIVLCFYLFADVRWKYCNNLYLKWYLYSYKAWIFS